MFDRTFKLALLLATCALPAYAAADKPKVEEVVITGAPYARTAGDILSHVDVVTAEELSQQTGGLGDVLSHLPGIESTFFGPGASRPVIRGLSGYRVLVLTNGLGMLDAASLSPDHAPAAESMTAQRVEIFRGPAALAYGGAAIGGVVNVIDNAIPERLPDDADYRLRAYHSSVDSGYGFGAASTVKLRDHFGVNLGFSTRSADDYDSPLGRVENSAVEAASLNGGFAVHGQRGFFGLSADRLTTAYGIPGEEATIDLEQTRYAVRGLYRFADGWLDSVRLNLGVADYTHAELEDGDVGTRFNVTGVEGRLEFATRSDRKSPGGFGVQYAARDVEAIGDEAFLPAVEVIDLGVFGQKQMDFGRWGVEFGGRVDQSSRNTASTDRSYTNWSAAGGVYWRPASGVKLGLALSRTARAPSEAELYADGPHVATATYELGDADLDTEVATTLEASALFRRGRITLDVHAFYADFKDYIDLYDTGDVEDGLPVYAFEAHDAVFKGGEVKIDLELYRRDDIFLNADLAADVVRGETSSGSVPRLPPLSTTLGLDAGWNWLTGRIEWVHADDQTRVSVGESTTDGYDLFNLSLAAKIASTPISLTLEGRNLTDEEAHLSTSFLKDTAPLPGRNVRIGIKAEF